MNESNKDLMFLESRNLIAARDAYTAQANRELSNRDWLSDHGHEDYELSLKISDLINKIKLLLD